ncbi:protein germ cell-less-like [Drosophila miranda]|uniref:protein germ cell-less-like n=1 Tax=Drosophila miranda TaxID=7229 RepID=UPI0007E7BECA|nr:protein germ cell-less-like [Drosophila miranda]
MLTSTARDALLGINHGQEERSLRQLNDDQFLDNCMRIGHVRIDPVYQTWRWMGFNFGRGLTLIVDSRRLKLMHHYHGAPVQQPIAI